MKHFNFLSNFRWFTTVILLITLGIGQMWAGYDLSEFTSSSFGGLSSAWSSSGSASSFESTGSARGVQWQKNASTTFTATGFSNVTSVHLWVAKSSSGTGSVKIQENTSAVKTISSFNTTSTEQVHKWGAASPYTGTVKVVVNATKSSIYMKKILVTFLTSITLNANGGSTNRTATIDNDSTSCKSFTACTRSGYTCTGYWTASSGGTKILNANGSLAGANITVSTVPYTSSSKWVYAGATLTLYAQWESAASCSANPSIGDASLNGSISLSSIPLSISSVGGGTDCTLAEYGFVWKSGSNPSASDNKTKIGESSSATSFSGNITGSFSTGVTYYIKGYAINNGPNTTLSTNARTVTPQSVTFNSNGGSSVSMAYVNNGATVSKPSNPTKTGYTFGTWQLSGSDYNFSTTVTDNITLDATWNAKTTAIMLNKNNSDASGSTAGSASYTYGESTKNSYTAATRTGYTLNGYYTSTSAGTKILNADGSIAGSSIVVSTVTYTDGSGNWAYDNTALTLYAQWTIKNYTVTWKVNGEDYTAGTPTDNVNHGSHVTTLPTAPSTASYCGDKFMGWTDADGGVYTHGTSNLYTKASDFPNATAAQTFYAVFADYAE